MGQNTGGGETMTHYLPRGVTGACGHLCAPIVCAQMDAGISQAEGEPGISIVVNFHVTSLHTTFSPSRSPHTCFCGCLPNERGPSDQNLEPSFSAYMKLTFLKVAVSPP